MSSFDEILYEVSKLYEPQSSHSLQVRNLDKQLQLPLIIKYAYSPLTKNSGHQILLCRNSQTAIRTWEILDGLLHQEDDIGAGLLVHTDSWGVERGYIKSRETTARVRTISKSILGQRQIIVATLMGLCEFTLTLPSYFRAIYSLKKGNQIEIDDLVSLLTQLGYSEHETINQYYQFVVHGGIIDIFSPFHDLPQRIEFFGNKVASLRLFDPTTQRSALEIETITLIPKFEFVLWNNELKSHYQNLHEYLLKTSATPSDKSGILDAIEHGLYFRGVDNFSPIFRYESDSTFNILGDISCLWMMDHLEELLDSHQLLRTDINARFSSDSNRGKPTVDPNLHFAEIAQIEHRISTIPKVSFGYSTSKSGTIVQFKSNVRSRLPELEALPKTHERLAAWKVLLAKLLDDSFRMFILGDSDEKLTDLRYFFDQSAIKFKEFSLFSSIIRSPEKFKPGLYIGRGTIETISILDSEYIAFIPASEILGKGSLSLARGSSKRALKSAIKGTEELKSGDYVVHRDHGICQYMGFERISTSNLDNEFLHLRFSDGDKLFLPIDKLNLLHRYVSGSSTNSTPELDRFKINSTWEKRTSAAKKAINDIAAKLLNVKANRLKAKGISFSAPSELYFEFENDFPHQETEDQLSAISDINRDLSSPIPMDRLVCGDVGFGKTEVAMRAAMRVIIDGYQVLMVVPTTILCFQHHQTIKKRFDKFGVTSGLVSRFQGRIQIKETLERFSTGKIDILVGTHRALSKDVIPHRLGLLIIDEEHKFGVTHKETIKEIAGGCDLLTLTATPIPRTLHMATLGIRDISVILTPPRQRRPVKTYVTTFDTDLIRHAILYEKSRNGQVFFVHNRVQDIENAAQRIRELVPEVTVKVGHGQQNADQLEKTMLDFLWGNFDVLCCTTIIESGIDIPNANTLIINDSDMLGMSQIYQIKGRVGRSEREAFCYLMVRPSKKLSLEAQQRLDALAMYQELGAGFQIAGKDLEVRGAGDLLGSEQSGFIASVGFELYSDMLTKALESIEAQTAHIAVEPEIKMTFTAYMPTEFIKAEKDRLKIYRELFTIQTKEDLKSYQLLIIDRFGKIPAPGLNLFKLAQLKIALRNCWIQTIKIGSTGFIEASLATALHPKKSSIVEYLNRNTTKFKVLKDGRILLNFEGSKLSRLQTQTELLDSLIREFESMDESTSL